MHTATFILAIALLVLGLFGMLATSSASDLQTNAIPGLFFGGGILIASLYAFRERQHGMATASFLAFLAFLTSSPPVLGAVFRGSFDWLRSDLRQASLIMTLTGVYIAVAFFTWRRARRAKALSVLRGGFAEKGNEKRRSGRPT